MRSRPTSTLAFFTLGWEEALAVAASGYDLVADATVDGTVRLARGGVAVTRED
ncbi:hypothetical protein [Terrabacter sp. BE26]|uniref:hypothetical protein n=1 Tax=Terrabacter sp. BE26 TaxID=2898152 RepID=UPI0035BE24AD